MPFQLSSQTNYASWAERYNFSSGDVLVFKYVKGQHNVYEVTEDTFRSCDASSGVLAKFETGEDQVALSEVKRYWFICNVAGHCLGGMRFGIEVKDGNNNVTNSTDVAFNPPIEPTPSDNSCTSYYVSERWGVIKNLTPLGLLLFNYYF
ncbi:hypothetical protein AAZX31_20G096200 [Glycine max]|uniref:Phytocyanin domain-containing protein n=2 Tax=Glycine subgen. Soja TaxID=1462606 RepID=K7N2S8_SOYBN|nr:hypothetical protein GYH30_055479 [Glycine max]KRG90675.1 hypothetical protein GLYMA_20G107400v4 [Glycine max]